MKEYERIGKGKICLPNYRDKEVTSDNFERCVKLSNLPWTVDKEKIINFFVGFTLPPSDISIQVDRAGRKNGYQRVSDDHGSIVSIATKPVRVLSSNRIRALCAKLKISGYKNKRKDELVLLLF